MNILTCLYCPVPDHVKTGIGYISLFAIMDADSDEPLSKWAKVQRQLVFGPHHYWVWKNVSDSLTNWQSYNRSVELQVGSPHYWVLCVGQPDLLTVIQSGHRTTGRTPPLLGIMYRTVWLTYRQTIGASDYRSDPVITGYYVSDSLTNLPSDNRGVEQQLGPRHYWVLCIGQSDIRSVGLQVGPVNTG